MIIMSLNKKPSLCRIYRILKLTKAGLADQSLENERKKIGMDLTWNRLRILYQFQEYLKFLNQNSHNMSKYWIQLLQRLPEIFDSKQLPRTSSYKPSESNVSESESSSSSDPGFIMSSAVKDDENTSHKSNESNNLERKETSYTLPMIGGWKTKSFQSEGSTKPNAIPKWINNVPITSSATIISRTRQLLMLIDNAESVQSRLKRIEDLITFLIQNPDTKLIAVKEGAIRKLLHVKRRTKDYATHRILREAFALLGHIEPLPCRGIRILTVDGGGIRGIAVIDMLRKLEELTGKKIYELFDYICGVSTGSILVSCIGTPQGMSLDEAYTMYSDFGTKLFTQSPFWGVSNLVLSRAYYDTTMFEQLLKKFVGEMPLIKTNRDANCPKLASVSTVMNQSSIMPFVFRNYALPCDRQSQYLGSCKYTLFESVRASGAAPTVFQEFCLDGMVHQDGGILVNNPCALAIHEAKLLWPNNDIQCVISCGTGRRAPVSVAAYSSKTVAKVSSVSWKTLFNRILESATDTEAAHTMLNDLLPPNVYFRFNPYLTDLIPMHENKSEKISQLREETGLYIRRNEEKFVDAATNLLIKRTATQKLRDFVELKCFEYGIKNAACKV